MAEFKVSSLDEWDAALIAAQPGDVVRLVGDVPTRLAYRGVGEVPEVDQAVVITSDQRVWMGGVDEADRG